MFTTTAENFLADAAQFEDEQAALMEAQDAEYREGCAEYHAGTSFNPFWPTAKREGFKEQRMLHDADYAESYATE